MTAAICWDVFPLELSLDLKRAATIRRLDPGQDLFLQGDKSGEIFAILSGRTKAWRVKEDGVLCTMLLLGPSEIIGAVGMMQGAINPVSVTALDKSRPPAGPLRFSVKPSGTTTISPTCSFRSWRGARSR